MSGKSLANQRTKSSHGTKHIQVVQQMPIKNFAKLNQLLNPGLMKSSSHVTSRENIIASRLTQTPSSQSHVQIFNSRSTFGAYQTGTTTL